MRCTSLEAAFAAALEPAVDPGKTRDVDAVTVAEWLVRRFGHTGAVDRRNMIRIAVAGGGGIKTIEWTLRTFAPLAIDITDACFASALDCLERGDRVVLEWIKTTAPEAFTLVPLAMALTTCSLDVLRWLVESTDRTEDRFADTNTKSRIAEAIGSRGFDAVTLFVERGIISAEDVVAPATRRNSFIDTLIREGRLEDAKRILRHFAIDVSDVDFYAYALMAVCSRGDIDAVMFLVDHAGFCVSRTGAYLSRTCEIRTAISACVSDMTPVCARWLARRFDVSPYAMPIVN